MMAGSGFAEKCRPSPEAVPVEAGKRSEYMSGDAGEASWSDGERFTFW
jgi:hypothetical protein